MYPTRACESLKPIRASYQQLLRERFLVLTGFETARCSFLPPVHSVHLEQIHVGTGRPFALDEQLLDLVDIVAHARSTSPPQA